MKSPGLILTLLLLPAAVCAQERDVAEPASEACVLPTDPLELALELRRLEDPEPLAGKELRRYTLRQFAFPKRKHAFDRDPAIREALADLSSRPERSHMPEFVAAEHAGGRSIHWHLLNALYMNASRIRYYAEQAGSKRACSMRLSRLMLIGEAISLPRVKSWDERADRLREDTGVDFVEFMRPLNPLPPQAAPVYTGVAGRKERRAMKRLGKSLQENLLEALAAEDLGRVSDLVYEALVQIISWEEQQGVHWHMSRHTIGSIGYTALKGIEHGEAPGVMELTLDYLRAVVPHTVDYGRQVDRMAQPLHAEGSGIVVNEFTDQSFLQAYRPARGLAQALSR